MRLQRVWLIVRSGSQAAQRQARRSAEHLGALGVQVAVAASGLRSNPFPGLLASEPCLPDLAVVFGGDGSQPRSPWPVHSWLTLAGAYRRLG